MGTGVTSVVILCPCGSFLPGISVLSKEHSQAWRAGAVDPSRSNMHDIPEQGGCLKGAVLHYLAVRKPLVDPLSYAR